MSQLKKVESWGNRFRIVLCACVQFFFAKVHTLCIDIDESFSTHTDCVSFIRFKITHSRTHSHTQRERLITHWYQRWQNKRWKYATITTYTKSTLDVIISCCVFLSRSLSFESLFLCLHAKTIIRTKSPCFVSIFASCQQRQPDSFTRFTHSHEPMMMPLLWLLLPLFLLLLLLLDSQ